jgi:signal transduction histidine kinase
VTFWMVLAILSLTSITLVLTHFRQYNTAIWYFLLVGTAFYAFDAVAKKHDGTEYTLITYGLAGLMFLRSNWLSVGYFALNVFVFFLVRYLQQVVPPFLYIPEMTDLYDTNSLTGILAMFAVVYYFKSENERQEALLANQNEQLQASLHDLHAAQAQLIQREKLASLGELTAGVAHEMQNPLNFVTNFANLSHELLKEIDEERAKGPTRDEELEAELLADLSQNVLKISEHGQRAAGIVRGMLEHSRSGKGERAPTNLNLLCTEYLRVVHSGLDNKGQSLPPCYEANLDTSLNLITVVPQDIGRVLANLYSNAFYAVWQRQQQQPNYVPGVWVRTQRIANGVQIRVRDNGVGIAPAIREKIFQPFFTTKPTGQGTGLGLSLSHDIVTKGYGGTLTVESEVGTFTEFTVTLPDR